MNFHHPFRPLAFAGLVLLVFLPACTTPEGRVGNRTPDAAYTQYWPPPEKSKRLRVAVKDLIDMKGIVTTAGSEFLSKSSPPAKRDAACLAAIRSRGLSIVGKTNLTELAVAPSGINEYYGTPRNPLNERRRIIPGGSSSGGAAAVANGTADISIATDTAGSIRVPAACCGVAGLKTTFGLVSLRGVYPISPTHLDTVGPLARDVAGLVTGMDLLQPGFAARYRSAVAGHPSAARIKIGRLYLKGTDSKIDHAIDEALRAKGFQVVPLGEDFRKRWVQAQKDAHAIAAASAWLSDMKFKNEKGVNARTKAVVALGWFQYKTQYHEALGRRIAWQNALAAALKSVDFIALPTLQTLPPHIPILGGTPLFEAKVLAEQNTAAVNLAGNPALAIPVPVHDRTIPVTSLQLIGPRFGEAELLNAGRLVEGKR